jgi:hypothetical protein
MTVVSNALHSTPARTSRARARIGSARAGHLIQNYGVGDLGCWGVRWAVANLLDAEAATREWTRARHGEVSPERTFVEI